jgi:Txe/YoeB family toxin of Txe-Axe toxin-antitoxin module
LARKHTFLNAEFAERWKESYQGLQPAQQNGVDKVVIALLKQKPTPGMRVKPIEPDKYYYEARINDGDRLIHRISEGTIHFIDIVSHDDIGKYSRDRSR